MFGVCLKVVGFFLYDNLFLRFVVVNVFFLRFEMVLIMDLLFVEFDDFGFVFGMFLMFGWNFWVGFFWWYFGICIWYCRFGI